MIDRFFGLYGAPPAGPDRPNAERP
jgi:hypothetical protein